ncbi:MotA/TolQ/ExbB proton channel family protein [Halomicronema sp. CCY15110]|uniref:MotA/TolQ/ExbB proton channel family protein n=1 Tax=Halomicronema sp. CCY15110 TaxID=2767773 RepID=UPI00194E90CE|nr:MotA/TolQ/ExbB proton channel family protein [Halomicronema sp. CCY15110]
MTTVFDFLARGGPVMVPIMGCSVLTIATALERTWFWTSLLKRESQVVNEVLEAARQDLDEAAAIAAQANDTPVGRFLSAPLRLKNPSPETFRLALENAGDKEFVQMRRGDKLLETIVAVAPLLGLLGTVTGLIATFNNLNIGGGGNTDTSQAAAGIGEALITTAAGMVVAILALLVFRIMVTFQGQQMDYFSEAGNELELIYRQYWYEPALSAAENPPPPPRSEPFVAERY